MTAAAIILQAPESFDYNVQLFSLTPVQRLNIVFRRMDVKRVLITAEKTAMKIIEKTAAKINAEFIYPGKGRENSAAGALTAALTLLRGKYDRTLLAPANFPLFETETARRLLESEAPLAVPVYNGFRGWPLSLSADMTDALLENGGDVSALLAEYCPTEIETDDPGVITENTSAEAEDIARAHSLHTALRPHIKLTLAYEQSFFGHGILQLIRTLESAGTVTKTVELMGISPSYAWSLIRKFEEHSGIKVFTFIGRGRAGTICTVTDECREFIARYEAMTEAVIERTQEEFERFFGDFRADGTASSRRG